MPILQLVSSNQANANNRFLGDIIGVFEDDHVFSDTELANYEFLSVATAINTREEVVRKMQEIDFRYSPAHWNSSTGEFQFEDPMEDPVVVPSIEVWSPLGNPIKWYTLAEPFGYKFNIQDLTAEEKQLIAGIDINHPSVSSALLKLRKNVADTNPANNVEVVELRNMMP